MCVDHLDNCHRAQQKERDPRRRSDGLVELMSKAAVISSRKRVNRPEQSSAKQCECRFVDFEWVFQRDGGVDRDKDQNKRDNQGKPSTEKERTQSYAPQFRTWLCDDVPPLHARTLLGAFC